MIKTENVNVRNLTGQIWSHPPDNLPSLTLVGTPKDIKEAETHIAACFQEESEGVAMNTAPDGQRMVLHLRGNHKQLAQALAALQ
jgi:hypothetical protein